jgi:hypothetical protein
MTPKTRWLVIGSAIGVVVLIAAGVLAWFGASAEPTKPDPNSASLVARGKLVAMVVNAVRAGEISLEEVCRRYELSVEEFLAWQRAIDTHGVPGLRVTRLQIYRDNPPSRVAKLRS